MIKKSTKTKNIEDLSEKAKISRMITAIASKDYSKATKFLESVLSKKLEKRIKEEMDNPIF